MNAEIQQNILELITTQKSLHLSTLNADGFPQASYAPYYFDKQSQQFFVMLSGLSAHTDNLINKPIGSIMIIADESASQQIFARQRVNYQINAVIVEDEMDKDIITGAMLERFGEIISTLTSLPDFRIFALQPNNGVYVQGFGGAFNIVSGVVGDMRPAMESRN